MYIGDCPAEDSEDALEALLIARAKEKEIEEEKENQ
jgi:hypothetical protein